MLRDQSPYLVARQVAIVPQLLQQGVGLNKHVGEGRIAQGPQPDRPPGAQGANQIPRCARPCLTLTEGHRNILDIGQQVQMSRTPVQDSSHTNR